MSLVALFLLTCGENDSSPEPAANEIAAIGDCVEASEVEALHLETSDGVEIAGVQWGTKGNGVVLGHMSENDLCTWAVNGASEIAEAGYRVSAIDFRNFGSSGSGEASNMPNDILAAVAHLDKQGA